MGHSAQLQCRWRVGISVLETVGGPDMQGALVSLKDTRRHLYRTCKADRLGNLLGIHPLYIACWCCMVRPLAAWEQDPRFEELTSTLEGHKQLKLCATQYRKANKFWPSPYHMFVSLLGAPPISDVRLQNRRLAAELARFTEST
jgi:DNA-binding transcriptional regulator YdaS (Cro superfamily)